MTENHIIMTYNPSYLSLNTPIVSDQGNEFSGSSGNKNQNTKNEDNYKGRSFSEHSRRILKKRAQWFNYGTKYQYITSHKHNQIYKYKLAFITLTLPAPQQHTNNKIKSRLLNNYLTYLRKNHNLTNYIWKAELQKNGNIHFHIITDLKLPYQIHQNIWNMQCEALNYITRFEKKHGKRTPPSTNVKLIFNSKNLNYYIGKYFSKISEEDIIEGRHWSCSSNISKLDNKNLKFTLDEFMRLEELVIAGIIGYKSDLGFRIWFITSRQLSIYFPTVIDGQVKKIKKELVERLALVQGE